jgi:hypothetical protein
MGRPHASEFSVTYLCYPPAITQWQGCYKPYKAPYHVLCFAGSESFGLLGPVSAGKAGNYVKLFDCAVDGSRGGLVFLAPARAPVPSLGWRIRHDDNHYRDLLCGAQRLRGRTYLEDGAISEGQLTSDGRHWQALDATSWHLLALDHQQQVCGCTRYSHYSSSVGFQDLGVRTSEIARSEVWGGALRSAVETEVQRARRRGIAFAEVGGWAISQEKRFTAEALRIALATYGLAQLLGGSVGLTTATVRHHSAQILRRIGGRPLAAGEAELPPYYDSQYQCQMEVLRFDSAQPDPVFRQSVDRLRDQLLAATVVAPRCAPALPYTSSVLVPALEPLPWPAIS